MLAKGIRDMKDADGKVVLQWSGGKDSAMALHRLREQGWEVESLLASFTEDYGHLTMHGVPRDLIAAQVDALGRRLVELWVPPSPTNEAYEARLREVLDRLRERGIRNIATGDLFLEGIRRYREENLKRAGMGLVTPLWGTDTGQLIREFSSLGYRAVTVCTDAEQLDESYVGCELDESFVTRLPGRLDPCGEHGEYHSFVYAGPLFERAVDFEVGEVVTRNGHHYCELTLRASQEGVRR